MFCTSYILFSSTQFRIHPISCYVLYKLHPVFPYNHIKYYTYTAIWLAVSEYFIRIYINFSSLAVFSISHLIYLYGALTMAFETPVLAWPPPPTRKCRSSKAFTKYIGKSERATSVPLSGAMLALCVCYSSEQPIRYRHFTVSKIVYRITSYKRTVGVTFSHVG